MAVPPGHFRVDVREEAATLVVAPQGEIDLGTVDEVRKAIERAHDGKSDLVLDLSSVTFLDTSGIRLIVEHNDRARDGGYGLKLVPGPPPVQRVFEIAGLEAELPFGGRPDQSGPGG